MTSCVWLTISTISSKRSSVLTVTHEDMIEVAFLQDEKTQDAVIRNFEIIGEASRASSDITPSLLPRIPTYRGASPTRCGLLWPMDTSQWT